MKSRSKPGTVVVVALLLLVAAGAGYAFLVEPYWLETSRHALPGQVTERLRIAHLSDLHSTTFGSVEQKLVTILQAEKPDLIVITGDLTADGRLETSRPLLTRLDAPLGVYVIRGEADRAGGGADERAFFSSVGVRLLVNQGVAPRPDFWLMGVDDPITGDPDLRAALEGAPGSAFKIALFHAPDYFKQVAGLFHLGLSGHTHGGQIWLPGLGVLGTAAQQTQYVDGWYKKNGSHLYVSRGLGLSSLPARVFRRPEVAIIDVVPSGR